MVVKVPGKIGTKWSNSLTCSEWTSEQVLSVEYSCWSKSFKQLKQNLKALYPHLREQWSATWWSGFFWNCQWGKPPVFMEKWPGIDKDTWLNHLSAICCYMVLHFSWRKYQATKFNCNGSSVKYSQEISCLQFFWRKYQESILTAVVILSNLNFCLTRG